MIKKQTRPIGKEVEAALTRSELTWMNRIQWDEKLWIEYGKKPRSKNCQF
jgi:hypothetical protein